MSQPTIIECNTKIVSCGGDPNLGHPVIYLEIEKKGIVICPYCSRKYVYKKVNLK